jgi:hypothetical protein
MPLANELVGGSTPAPIEKAPAATVVKADAPKKSRVKRKATSKAVQAANQKPRVYLQNNEGRVFIADDVLIKQFKKRKFGLSRINEGVYLEAMENGGMTDPIIDDLNDDDI